MTILALVRERIISKVPMYVLLSRYTAGPTQLGVTSRGQRPPAQQLRCRNGLYGRKTMSRSVIKWQKVAVERVVVLAT